MAGKGKPGPGYSTCVTIDREQTPSGVIRTDLRGLKRTATQIWSLLLVVWAWLLVAAACVELNMLLLLLCRESTTGVAGRPELDGREPPATKLRGIRKVLVLLSESWWGIGTGDPAVFGRWTGGGVIALQTCEPLVIMDLEHASLTLESVAHSCRSTGRLNYINSALPMPLRALSAAAAGSDDSKA